jgi:2-keto-4-pentenoate hydratase
MGREDVEVIAESLWRSRRHGVYYPEEWKGRLTLAVAYRVQLALLDRYLASGERQAGWKVGLTAPAIQRQVGIHEPVFGFLLESGAAASGVAFRFDELIRPAFENELCLTIGRPLEGPGVTLEAVGAAVSAVAPALEIVERRGDAAADVPLSIADNCQQRAFVVGPASGPPAASGDPAAATVEVYLNGRLAERASGAEVMGTPLASVAWLAERLSRFGRRLEPGMRVMSGSFTRQYPVDEPGTDIEARFAPYGSARARFS